MICSRLICTTVLCLASAGLYAQGQGVDNRSPSRSMQQQSNQRDAWQSQRYIRETEARRFDHRKKLDWNPNLGWSENVGKKRPKQVWSLTEARENLAREWRRLGIPGDQATVIAAAYDAHPLHHPSLRGESKRDIASSLQKAIESGNYRLANQLLIDYQHANLQRESAQ